MSLHDMAIKNIYLFYGEEQLIISNKISHLIREIPTNEHNISIYDLDESNLLDVIQDASMAPFLADYKVIIVKNPHFLSNEKDDENENAYFLRYLDNPNDSTVLIIDAFNIKLDKKKAVVKTLLKKAEVSETNTLTDVEMKGWLIRQLSKENISIKEDAIRLFFNLVGSNLLMAKNEIDKLTNYVGPGNTITTQTINESVVKELEKDVFSLSNSIIANDKQKAINIYQQLINDGNNPNYLFSLISKSIRELLVVQAMLGEGYKQSDIARILGFSSGRAYYAVKNARGIDYNIIQDYVIRLGNLDYKIKSGQIDVQTGLDFLILGL